MNAPSEDSFVQNDWLDREATKEKTLGTISGWVMLPIALGLIGFAIFHLISSIHGQVTSSGALNEMAIVWAVLRTVGMIIVFVLLCVGFFTLQPNEARVLILFGDYRGSVRKSGFHWTNPFYTKRKISLRSHNLNGEKLKVNDLRGNPIEIAAVVVWRVADTAQAAFDVEDYANFVEIQSESAVRDLASSYNYDDSEGDSEFTLRGGGPEVSDKLKAEVQDRVDKAGILVEEARVAHLAYAPEIASAMLKRQQAEAIIAARRKIVEGAVSMVEHALEDLAAKKILDLDDEKKASMVSNLLVILCGDRDATPVVNAGTLYA